MPALYLNLKGIWSPDNNFNGLSGHLGQMPDQERHLGQVPNQLFDL
jgi:hypothetical protein